MSVNNKTMRLYSAHWKTLLRDCSEVFCIGIRNLELIFEYHVNLRFKILMFIASSIQYLYSDFPSFMTKCNDFRYHFTFISSCQNVCEPGQ